MTVDPGEPVSHPLTCNEVINALTKLVERDAMYGDWPVHILDMDPDRDKVPAPPENMWDGLVTHIETDCFQAQQGNVVGLFAWRDRFPQHGGKSEPWTPRKTGGS